MKKILSVVLFLSILVLCLSGCIKLEITKNASVETAINAEVNEPKEEVNALEDNVEKSNKEDAKDGE